MSVTKFLEEDILFNLINYKITEEYKPETVLNLFNNYLPLVEKLKTLGNSFDYSESETKSIELQVDNFDFSFFSFNRKLTIVGFPLSEKDPFISISIFYTENGEHIDFSFLWTKFQEKRPERVSSAMAFRDDFTLPSAFKGSIENNKVLFDEVQYTKETHSYLHCLKNNVLINSKMIKKGELSFINDLNEPFNIEYYENGVIKSLFFFDHLAKNPKEIFTTVDFKSDIPLFVSFYPDGKIDTIDYTGVSVSNKLSILPFSSRFNYFLPSYIKLSPVNNNNEQLILKRKYFFNKEEKKRGSLMSILSSRGINPKSEPLVIRKLLSLHPDVDKQIKRLLFIEELSNDSINKFIQISNL